MFPFTKKRVYLDWASGAPVSKAAQSALNGALKVYGNPSSPHEEGVRAKQLLEEARTTIARLAEVKPSGVVFTSGATEANSLALLGVVMKAKESEQRPHVLYLPSAHASVIESLHALGRWEVEVEPLRITDGRIDLVHLKTQIRPETRLVTVDAVCSETGTRWDTRGVKNALMKEKSRAFLHVDASQAPPTMPFSLTRLSADLLTLDAQKVGGVRGIGALCMRSRVKLTPILHGGGQEGGMRPGTEAVPLIRAFAKALQESEGTRDAFRRDAERMRTSLINTLSQALPDLLINQGKEGVPHILNLSFPGRDTDYAVMLLDKEGFAVATKSACETDSEHGSRAVLALTNDISRASSTLRVSWGPKTSVKDLKSFASALIRVIRFLDASSV